MTCRKPELLKGVYDMGFNAPSYIQETALPALLADPLVVHSVSFVCSSFTAVSLVPSDGACIFCLRVILVAVTAMCRLC